MAMKVLIAVEDVTTRAMLEEVLRREGYDAVVAENGRVAAETLSSTEGPRLALLDGMLPELDGPAICREVRGRRKQPYVYIILLAFKSGDEEAFDGLEAGADDILTKPFDAGELRVRLRTAHRMMQLEDRLAYNALHDALTQLPNRSVFLERLSQCVLRAKKHPDYKFAVLLVDLDGFKKVNAGLGHRAADQLIFETAVRLTRSIRSDDLLSRPVNFAGVAQHGSEDTVARLGGDEFIVVLEDIRNASDALRVAERIQQQLAFPLLIRGHEVFTTASVGIALSDSGYETAEEMLRDADTALHRAKGLGESRCEIFDRTMHVTAVNRLKLETDLRRGIEREEFRLHYLPIVSLKSGHIQGFEALLRWQRPGTGLVAPLEFLTVAEETGLIGIIGKWVLSEACRKAKAWNEQFPSGPPITMAVNISAKQFAQPGLATHVAQVLQETGLDACNLTLELTESAAMRDPERTAVILGELKALGVRVSVDDFGTGYSSLSYLQRFPIDTLKIDRSFVSDIEENKESQEIVQAIVTLAHNLRMEVVAEGSDTTGQLKRLRDLGCEFVEGYYFSKPLDQEAATEYLRTSGLRPQTSCEPLATQLSTIRLP
jgi:predicted signal transduction protein with EAL and GGDEF domain